jgi:hypothetical protein
VQLLEILFLLFIGRLVALVELLFWVAVAHRVQTALVHLEMLVMPLVVGVVALAVTQPHTHLLAVRVADIVKN